MAIPEPTSFWNMDESLGDAADATATGNTLTNVLAVTYTTGLIGNAADVETTLSNYLSHADDATLSPTGNFSFACFFNPESNAAGGERGILSKYGGAGARSFFLRQNSSTVWEAGIVNSADAETDVTWTISALSTATWYHIAWTYNAAAHESILYVDGASQGAKDSVRTDVKDGTAEFRVGNGDNSSVSIDGLLDMVGFWNGTTLSGTEVGELYNGGVGVQYPFAGAGGETRDARKMLLMGVG